MLTFVTSSDETGSAPLETTFAIALLLVVVLATIQLVLAVYAKNILQASAHEAARALAEADHETSQAQLVAARVIDRSAGGLFGTPQITLSAQELPARQKAVTVDVAARLRVPGPLPIAPAMRAVATIVTEESPR